MLARSLRFLCAGALLSSSVACTTKPRSGDAALSEKLTTAQISEIIASPDRSAADRTNRASSGPGSRRKSARLVTLMFNYHDLGHLGVDRSRTNSALFTALKPGGWYVVADHAGRAGTGISEAGTLHRIEEDFLRHETENAGFVLVAKGNFLRNPADPRDRNTPLQPQTKDDFVMKFVKP